MMVVTPRPSSPARRAQARADFASLDAVERLPILSFKRWIKKLFFAPSGFQRGRRKQVNPFGVCAKTRKASHMGAEQNHLCPVIRYSPAAPAGSATVVLARTSEPPCFSVMAMPINSPDFSEGGRNRES